MVPDLPRHVADQRGEYRLLAVEIGVECAQRDLGPPCDADDRTVMKSTLAEFQQGRVEDLSKRFLAPRRTRRLALAGRRNRSPHGTIR
jgi:hypothetical protein